MNKCKYLKQRQKDYKWYGFCSKKKEKVPLFCKECDVIEYKERKPMKLHTNKHAKVEKERFSIIYPDLTKCCICGSNSNINKHEVFYGKNRQNSIKYGLVIPLCLNHHTGDNGIHYDNELNIFYKRLAQKKWESIYGNRNDFLNVFGRSWL